MDNESFRQARFNFADALKSMAAFHMNAGDDTAAGILLVLERRVYSAMLDYDIRVPPDGRPSDQALVTGRRRRKKDELTTTAVQTEITEP